jgi:hypothetical protein
MKSFRAAIAMLAVVICAAAVQARNVNVKISQSGTTLEGYSTFKPVAIRVNAARHASATGTVSVAYTSTGGDRVTIQSFELVGTSNVTVAVTSTNYLVKGDVITPTLNWTNTATEVFLIMEE